MATENKKKGNDAKLFLRDPQKEITTGRLAHKVVAGYNLDIRSETFEL